MKWLLFSILSFLFLSGNAQVAPLPAEIVLANALEQASAQHKKVFLKFGASWCSWCKRLDANIKTDPAKSFFNANFIVADVTVHENTELKHLENKGAEELLQKYNGLHEGLPYFIIFDENGAFLADSQKRKENSDDFKVKGENIGCPASPEEVDHFLSILKKTSTIGNKEAEAIQNQFLNR